ncbi:MAG: hypothetical protein AUJ12_02065 [Alphaproteobacteria bacterium CG1_02_46_17]|nr:MAG: hypothetical protein AUJ12_02065 [Alphaproteobacteria bacterium CG1_02_46_17]
MACGWTPEKRKSAAARCRANRPWQKSTGPRTDTGKIASSRNSYKTGYHSCARRELRSRGRALIRANTELCHILLAWHLQKTQKPAKRTEFGEDVLPFSPLHFHPEPPKYRPYFNSQRLRR